MPAKPSVLFVCLGNICRSPTAEAVLRHKVQAQGLDIVVDSAGTHGYHIGSPPDKRSQAAAEQRGYSCKGLKCRKVAADDFARFDYILAMDNSNLENLRDMSDAQYHGKIRLLGEFLSTPQEVPDPYYGGKQAFERVLDLIEEACAALLTHIQTQHVSNT